MGSSYSSHSGTETCTVYEVIARDPQLKTLKAAIDRAGLQSALSGPGPLTVFAPTDTAFNAFMREFSIDCPENLLSYGLLTDLLKNHVVSGKYLSNQINDCTVLTGLNNNQFQIERRGTQIYLHWNSPVNAKAYQTEYFKLNDRVVQADICASNGVVHKVNRVII